MLAANIPPFFPVPFASSAGAGFIRTIPTASQIPTTPGAASLTDGFPPLTFLPVSAGGVPPFGQDMNGILNELSANLQWYQAGGTPKYNSAFSTAIGGYPNGALLQNAAGTGLWCSTVDNNTSNPDTGGANWTAGFGGVRGEVVFSSAGTANFTVPTGIYAVFARVWGGGAGGGGANQVGSAAGGGAGGYTEGWFAVTPGQVISVTVGTGGAGGLTTPTNGTNGGSSSFGALCSATGGVGGQLNLGGISSGTGASGTGSGGTLNLSGGLAGQGYQVTSGYVGGLGAAPVYGSIPVANTGSPGVGASFAGGGGNGASGNFAGGAGAAGRVIVVF